MSKVFNDKFVYFRWDENLEGKKGFVAQDIENLEEQVTSQPDLIIDLVSSRNNITPFMDKDNNCEYRFAYYDPNYEIKWAYYKENKDIQKFDGSEWIDVTIPNWSDNSMYRIKPTFYVYITNHKLEVYDHKKDGHCYYNGDYEECKMWINEHNKFINEMIAWEKGSIIQYYNNTFDKWIDCECDPNWNSDYKYRIKGDKHKPFETIDEFISAWEEKNPSAKNRPSVTMPIIWIRRKNDKSIHMVMEFYPNKTYDSVIGTDDEYLKFSELFENYEFLDGTPCGKGE